MSEIHFIKLFVLSLIAFCSTYTIPPEYKEGAAILRVALTIYILGIIIFGCLNFPNVNAVTEVLLWIVLGLLFLFFWVSIEDTEYSMTRLFAFLFFAVLTILILFFI